MKTIYGLVLAGGQSRRMGSDKASLTIGDMSLLEIMSSLLVRAGCVEVRVSSNQLESAVKDEYYQYGPVAGIHAGLKSYLADGKQGGLLVVPVDMPVLSPATLQALCSSDLTGTIVRYNNQYLPLYLDLTTQNITVLSDLLAETTADRGISLKRMFQQFKEHIITPESEISQEFVNCNSEADFNMLRAHISQK